MRLEETIRQSARSAVRTIHISVHSFTPQLNHVLRNADIGLLYDPRREAEKQLCLALQFELGRDRPDLTIRRNYPYRGTDDGLTRYLRCRFAADQYLGIELEVNQKWPLGDVRGWRGVRSDRSHRKPGTFVSLARDFFFDRHESGRDTGRRRATSDRQMVEGRRPGGRERHLPGIWEPARRREDPSARR